MKKLSCYLAIFVAGTLVMTTAAQASGYGHGGGYDRGAPQHRIENRIDKRQSNQWARIRDGSDSGVLSRGEARRLLKNQRQIARMEKRFERDGYYSPRERKIMDRALDRASHRIRRAKNNDISPRHGRHHDAWHHDYRRHAAYPYAYAESGETYVAGRSTSTTISAQTDGFSVSWSTSDQE